MINISNEAKEKYKGGIIPKEMVVSFPNGEHADIHNDEIVAESLEFQENLVKGEFKFGLCQANYLKFETVADVSECTGAVIDVSIFIDGTEISLGRFTIDTITKSDGLYTIASYGTAITPGTAWSDLEKWKRNFPALSQSNYTVSVDDLSLSQKVFNTSRLTMVNSIIPTTERVVATWSKVFPGINPVTVTWEVRALCISLRELSAFSANGLAYAGKAQRLFLEEAEEFENYKDIITAYDVHPINDEYLKPFIEWIYGGQLAASSKIVIDKGNPISLWMPGITLNTNLEAYICFPYKVVRTESQRGGGFTPTIRTYEAQGFKNQEAKIYSINNYASYSVTLARDYAFNIPETTQRAYAVSEDTSSKLATTVINDLFELQGILGKASRDGAYQFVALETATGGTYPSTTIYPSASAFPSVQNAVTINMDEYEDFDIKADKVEPFGAVFYDYTDTSNQKAVGLYQFNEAYNNAYYIKGNSLLTSAPSTEIQINAMLDASFIPNLKKVMWTKSKIDMTAMPWLESGDPIAVKTNDNTFATYVFNRTLKGIQAGMDEIDSDVSASDTRVAPTN